MEQIHGRQLILAGKVSPATQKRFPESWRFVLTAWSRLCPHWNTDITTWTILDALSYPLPKSSSSTYPLGVSLSQVLAIDPLSGSPDLMTETQVRNLFATAAPARVWKAIEMDCVAPNSLGHQLLSLLLPLSLSSPFPSLPSLS